MDDVHGSLREARAKLTAFEDEAESSNLLSRLQATNPGHPLLLGRTLAMLGSFALLVATVAVLAVPVASRDLAATVSRIQDTMGFPLPIALGVCTLCLGAMGMALHQLALGAARNAPMLPDEAKRHQRLVADVKQLEARIAVEGTPRPAVRVTSR
mgnify:CR=1 FL=1